MESGELALTPADDAERIAVVGAGIAGASLALACRQAGLDIVVYERGAGSQDELLEITPNGSRVLQALGLKEALMAASITPDFATLRSARTGFLLSQRPLGAFSEARYGAPTCLIEHGTLQQLLRSALADHEVPIVDGTAVTDIDTARSRLSFSDGKSRQHLACAVATGRAPEAMNDLLESRDWAVDPAITGIRARGPRRTADRAQERFQSTYVGPGFLLTERPVPVSAGDEPIVELTAWVTAPRPEREATAALDGLLKNCHPHLKTLHAERQVNYVEVPQAPVAEFWQTGRAALLGEFCHGHPAHSQLAPAAALEDAWILSRMMERWEDEPHQGFGDYEHFRRSRAARLRRFAETDFRAQTEARGVSAWWRNFRWSLGSRFLPEIAMQRQDWLYGYDCIKGFY
ncbi:MAG: NAD(P)-binding protein [Pseudomonadota bacterium]